MKDFPLSRIKPTSMTDDNLLVARAKEDAQAFGALYDKYVERIYRYAYRQMNDEETAQDITAVTFENALRNLQKYEWRGKSFLAWLYRIARNEAMGRHRRNKVAALWRERQIKPEPAAERGVEAAVQSSERRQLLHSALNQLAAKDRDILILRYFEELSGEETAEILECSANNVYVRLHRAQKRLRVELEKLEGREDYVN